MPSERLDAVAVTETVAAIGEHALITRIRRQLTPAPDWVIW